MTYQMLLMPTVLSDNSTFVPQISSISMYHSEGCGTDNFNCIWCVRA